MSTLHVAAALAIAVSAGCGGGRDGSNSPDASVGLVNDVVGAGVDVAPAPIRYGTDAPIGDAANVDDKPFTGTLQLDVAACPKEPPCDPSTLPAGPSSISVRFDPSDMVLHQKEMTLTRADACNPYQAEGPPYMFGIWIYTALYGGYVDPVTKERSIQLFVGVKDGPGVCYGGSTEASWDVPFTYTDTGFPDPSHGNLSCGRDLGNFHPVRLKANW